METLATPLYETAPEEDRLDAAIERASVGLTDRQADDGHWAYELEADVTIPSEYILLNHFLGRIDDAVEAKLANYIRAIQGEHGGWPLYHDGDFDPAQKMVEDTGDSAVRDAAGGRPS